ncbi:hypothetical protein PAHAL_4G256900 [Panicum hallii]|jgi:hypothetical protein|uniref:Uncharacterized protein n=1 Tax=Panicum hallii TaxID=206008 RepID=A0A2T8JDY0_9POAL|nr:hypothetical protein PAHAL_4G256900 [Panicum hallii]
MLSCDVEVSEWESGRHSTLRPFLAGVSRGAHFLLSPALSLFHVGFRRRFAACNKWSDNWWDIWPAVLVLTATLAWALWMAPKMKYDTKPARGSGAGDLRQHYYHLRSKPE